MQNHDYPTAIRYNATSAVADGSQGNTYPGNPVLHESFSSRSYDVLSIGQQYIGPREKLGSKAKVLRTHALEVVRVRTAYSQTAYSSYSGVWSTAGYCGDDTFSFTMVPGAATYSSGSTVLAALDWDPNVLIAKAKEATLLAAADVQTNLAITMAEMPKTLRMLSDVTKRLARGYALFRKGKVVEAFKYVYAHNYTEISYEVALKRFRHAQTRVKVQRRKTRKPLSAADNWMMYQYGVIPLVIDVAGIAQAMAQRNYPKARIFKVSKTSYFDSESNTHIGASSAAPFVDTLAIGRGIDPHLGYRRPALWYDEVVSQRNYAKAWLTLEVVSQAGIDDNQLFGNALSLAYELVPFSFVVDHFIHIGKYLQNMTALSGLQVLDGGTSVCSEVQKQIRGRSNGSVLCVSPGGTVETTVVYSRSGWSGSSPPPLPGSMMNGNVRFQNFLTYTSILAQRSRS